MVFSRHDLRCGQAHAAINNNTTHVIACRRP
jgi:hypothetical protein